ncbi:hypothetical protein V6N13_046343 [Hibiscus sabdariffa]
MPKSALVFRNAFKILKTKYLPYTKELRKIFYEATLSFTGSRYAIGNTFVDEIYDIRHKLRYVEWIIRRSYDPSDSYDLCHRIKSTLTSLFDFYASSLPSSTHTRSSSFNPYSSGHDGEREIRKLK